MSKTLLALLTFSFAVFIGQTWGAEGDASILEKQDANFAHDAAICHMYEVRASDLVLKRGMIGNEKTFAQIMLDDHTKSFHELQAIAEKKHIVLPTTLDVKNQEQLDMLTKAEDKDYPTRYIESQVSTHKQAIELFSTEADKGSDVDLKNFATATLPTLKTHLDHAQNIEDKH